MKAAKIWFSITTATALILVVVGFIIPPMGVIDGSVLTAVGELMGFAALAQVPPLIKKGADVSIHHGSTSITVNNPDTDPEETTDNGD